MAKVTKESPTIKFQLRCPKPLHAKLKELAAIEGRSIHTQIIMILESHFESRRRVK